MILLALGSNLGDREANLAAARASLIAFDITVTEVSGIHETPALMPGGAPESWNMPYLNQVIAVETHLAPAELLVCLKHIESELGRRPGERWAPREIDIDILAYGDALVLTDALTIPHPHLDARDFVLRPLAEIAPNWRHPVLGKTVREMLAELAA
jgi:2-amino-4-hydroxy-6-hydroxymethyldihydropteridine diphosphokinase